MSFASEYKDRQRRRRNENTRYVGLVVRTILSSAVMIAVAVAFDLPGKLREKWYPKAAETVEKVQPPQPQQPIPHPLIISEEPSIPIVAVDPSPKPEPEILPPEPEVNPKEDEQDDSELMTLDLSKKAQIIILLENVSKGDEYPTVRIIALKEIETAYVLSSPDGLIDRGEELFINFGKFPKAKLRYSLNRAGTNIVLRIESQMELWTKNPMPFTLKKIKTEATKTRRTADQFFADLSDYRSEKTSREAWMKAPGPKDMRVYKNAELRVTTLTKQIKQMEGRVENVKKDVQIVNDLESLAQQLHKKAQLEYQVISKQE